MRYYRYPITAILLVLIFGIYFATKLALYDTIPHYDKIMHFAGGIAVAWFMAVFFRAQLRSMPFFSHVVFIAGTVAIIGIGWEYLEYASNHYKNFIPTLHYYLYGGDLPDTLLDLGFDTAGAILFALISSVRKG